LMMTERWSMVITIELKNHSQKWMTPLSTWSLHNCASLVQWRRFHTLIRVYASPSGESLSLIPTSWVLDGNSDGMKAGSNLVGFFFLLLYTLEVVVI
jgi:hypothetical protein